MDYFESPIEVRKCLQGDATLKHWVEGSEAHFILRAPAVGWLALGIEGPKGGMTEADIIYCTMGDAGVSLDSLPLVPSKKLFLEISLGENLAELSFT